MATADISGLFGGVLTPEEQQRQLTEARAMQFAQMNPASQLAFMGYKAGAGLGQGLAQAAGVDIQDPTIKRAAALRQMAQGIDVTTTRGLEEYANRLQRSGYAAEAAQLGQAISGRKQQEIQAELTRSKTAKEIQAVDREDQLRKELANLPENATEDQVLAVVRKFGDPSKVLTAIQSKQAKEKDLEVKAEMQKERLDRAEREREKDREFKLELAKMASQFKNATSDLQRQLIQEKIDALKQKKLDKEEKDKAAAEMTVENTKNVLSSLDKAEKLIGSLTTGWGSYLSVLPNSPARALASEIQTIKSRLGFDQLSEMRRTSPTGGALGAVSNKELDFLQSAVASLDTGLDQKTLKENIQKIKESYVRWQKAALRKLPEEKNQEISPETAKSPTVVDFKNLKQ